MRWLREVTRPLGRLFRRGRSRGPATLLDVSLDNVPKIPGMTNYRELQYFYWCCARFHRPRRRVVELGAWMGCSGVALASGVRESADPMGKVVSIDRFVWDEWAVANVAASTLAELSPEQRARLTDAELNPSVGDSFLPIFHACTAPMKDSIEAIDADLDSYQWTGEPIDVLMIDAAKSWETLDQIVRQFFPSLVDGAVVIHQDYKHWMCYWLHVVCERMVERGVLTIAENIPGLSTQGYRFHKTRDFDVSDYLMSAFSPAESERLIQRSMNRAWNAEDRLAVAGVYVNFLKLAGRVDEARRVFTNALRQGEFVDNWFLREILAENRQWARPFARETFAAIQPWVNSESSWIGLSGECSLGFGMPGGRKEAAFDAPALVTAGASEMVLSFSRDASAPDDNLRIRVEATDCSQSNVFYDEEFLVRPDRIQPVFIPLANRPEVGLRWRVVSEARSSDEPPMRCLGPVLLVA